MSESDAKRILVDLSEQFLGAYEYGQLMFSGPVAAGTKKNTTPVGEFRITGYSKMHKSSLYQIEHTTEPYPMSYGLRFYINREGGSYWIHGRDLPGYPASHGCIGLYDEEMQHDYYKYPEKPMLEDARKLFAWAIPSPADRGGEYDVRTGPKVLIIDHEPRSGPRSR
ncbi:MAG TPA: L,D-transpeptidase [Nitrospirota bacterium]|nr:L,D-transpeptidase [Nitrospirota bacterium]